MATGISDLIYEPKATPAQPNGLDDDLVNAWAANLGDDDLLGKNAPAMTRVRTCVVSFYPSVLAVMRSLQCSLYFDKHEFLLFTSLRV